MKSRFHSHRLLRSTPLLPVQWLRSTSGLPSSASRLCPALARRSQRWHSTRAMCSHLATTPCGPISVQWHVNVCTNARNTPLLCTERFA